MHAEDEIIKCVFNVFFSLIYDYVFLSVNLLSHFLLVKKRKKFIKKSKGVPSLLKKTQIY